jgi:hypothetical protein
MPRVTYKPRPILFDERLRSTGGTLLMCTLVATSTWLLAGCTVEPSEVELDAWGDSLIDAQTRMNAYQLRLETLRDAVDTDARFVEQCNPAKDKEYHETVTTLLESLAADAPKLGFKEDVIERLHHVQSEWQLLRSRQETKWSESAGVEGLDPRERCIWASGVAWTRMAIDRDMSSILKAFIRAR